MSIMDKIILVALVSLFTAVTTVVDADDVIGNYFEGCMKIYGDPTNLTPDIANVIGGTFVEAHNTMHFDDGVSISGDGFTAQGSSTQCRAFKCENGEDVCDKFEEAIVTPSASYFIWRFHFTYRCGTLQLTDGFFRMQRLCPCVVWTLLSSRRSYRDWFCLSSSHASHSFRAQYLFLLYLLSAHTPTQS